MNGMTTELKQLLFLALKRTPIDFGVSWKGGFRTAEDQKELFDKVPKVTTKDGYKKRSKHQFGTAVDVIPYINGQPDPTTENYFMIAGVFMACADELGLKLRWGGNWDMDQEYLVDQSFDDLPHFELI